ncbi:hypothetical protein CMV_001830 [Castanea mollissima]|uniref:Uncharacterized protein n=1 Tax=Castanea mollissima TaxID=60419 RepID=A0A8J4RK73_9ROSI|nr:hypothetical protein CMV_001830 [Castanea mollissima]
MINNNKMNNIIKSNHERTQVTQPLLNFTGTSIEHRLCKLVLPPSHSHNITPISFLFLTFPSSLPHHHDLS